jgi:hypothetical protein
LKISSVFVIGDLNDGIPTPEKDFITVKTAVVFLIPIPEEYFKVVLVMSLPCDVIP